MTAFPVDQFVPILMRVFQSTLPEAGRPRSGGVERGVIGRGVAKGAGGLVALGCECV